ncbi:MAG: response regulator [Ignavibacteriales bacterium]|nr:response regulator [Ignavibacteriales bacterium]
MKRKNGEFLKKLLDTFRVEAAERVKVLVGGLLRLEKSADAAEQADIVESLFRETHSLKGAARAVSSSEIERLCQSLETVFSSLKKGQPARAVGFADVLHRAVDHLEYLVSTLGSEQATKDAAHVSALAEELEKLSLDQTGVGKNVSLSGPVDFSAGAVSEPLTQFHPGATIGSQRPPETVRISEEKLDSLMLQAGEMVSMKLAGVQRSTDLQAILHEFESWKKKWRNVSADVRALRRSLEKEEHGKHLRENIPLRKVLDFMESSTSLMNTIEHRLLDSARSSSRDHRSLSFMVDSLLENAKQTLMFPFSLLLEAFPKVVRDLTHDQKKEADLVVSGEDIEIDRRVLEALKDPFIHLIRNCIDHGIETPEARQRKAKPRRGTITVSVSQKNGSNIEIGVSDDGSGIDPAAVRTAAVRNEIISQSEAATLSDNDSLDLIFQSGVSTSPIITDVSGRGLGLAIVRERVESLGGHVSVDSQPGRGTTFHLRVPVTVATFRAIFVRVAEHIFAVPAAAVERVVAVRGEEIRTLENRETVLIGGEILSLVRLDDVVGVPRQPKGKDAMERFQTLVLSALNKRMAFVVDSVLQEQEVLMKSLGPQMARVRNIGGATILGSGKVVPIVNVSDLMRSAVRLAGAQQPAPATETKEVERKISVLVVEDSITARTLVKSILTAAGYVVTTATDGIDALTQLRTADFDIVVSDVDMPRMNGFDLTAKIRSDKKLADLPVILVTALESREDREHGVDVGANAYIVKSSFDQSNLLEAMRRLV